MKIFIYIILVALLFSVILTPLVDAYIHNENNKLAQEEITNARIENNNQYPGDSSHVCIHFHDTVTISGSYQRDLRAAVEEAGALW